MTLLHTSLLINLRGTYSVQIFKKNYLRSYNNLSGRLVIIKLKKVQDSHQTPQLQILYETYFLCISFLTTLYYSSKNIFDQDNTYISTVRKWTYRDYYYWKSHTAYAVFTCS